MQRIANPLADIPRNYMWAVLFCVLLGLLVPGPMLALGISSLVSILVYRKSHQWERPWIFRLFVTGLSLRVGLILAKFVFFHYFGGKLSIFGDSDMYLYSSATAYWALLGEIDFRDKTTLVAGNYGFSIIQWIFGAIYLLLGYSPFLLHVLNALLSCLAAILVYLITMRLCSHHLSALTAMSMMLFFPSQIMWSIELLKEPMVACYSALIVYLFLEIVARKKWIYLPLVFIMCYPLGQMRSDIHLLMIATLTLASVFSIPRNRKAVLLIMLVGGLMAVIKLGPSGMNYYWDALQTKVIGKQIGFITTGGAWYKFLPDRFSPGHVTPFMSPVEFSVAYVKAVGYYMFTPFLTLEMTFNKLSALPQMMVWDVSMLVCFIPGLLYLLNYRSREATIIIIYMIVFTSAQALVTGSQGTAFRQRDTITLFYYIPIAIGFYNLCGWLAQRLGK